MRVPYPEINSGWNLNFSGNVSAGFPSPAADYAEQEIDLKNYLMPHPHATFIMKVEGDSMIGANIPSGAYLVIDRGIEPVSNNIIVAVINGEFTCKRLVKKGGQLFLEPSNNKFSTIRITDEMNFSIWGTVTRIIIDATKM